MPAGGLRTPQGLDDAVVKDLLRQIDTLEDELGKTRAELAERDS